MRFLPLALSLVVPAAALAQGLPDRLGAGSPPPGTVATVDEAHAVLVNPAGLGFMEGPQLVFGHSGLDYVGPTGASDGAWAGVRLLSRLALAGGAEWLRPPARFHDLPTFSAKAQPFQPLLGASVLRLSAAGAFRLTDEIALGFAYRHHLGETRRLYNLGTLDAGISLRPFRYLAAGLTLEQANSPFAGQDRMLRSVRAGLALRPYWERVTLSAEMRLDERFRLDTNLLARAEVLPGLSLFLNAFWLDMLSGSGRTLGGAVESRMRDLPLAREQFRGDSVASLERIAVGAGLQFDLEHFGGGFLASWSPGAGFLEPSGRFPDPLTGGLGTVGGVSAWGRVSAEKYPSMVRMGPSAIVIPVEGDLSGPGPDDPVEALMRGLGVDEGPGATLALLDRAAQDRRVKVVVLRMRGLSVGWGRIVEVRQRVEALRRAGKRVVAYMESGGDEEYHVASAADRVYLMPAGMLGLDGFAVQMQFLATTLEKLGIHVEAVAAGKYKSAPEQLTRTDPSPESLEVQRAILDGLMDNHVAAIARHRAIPAREVRDILDRGLLTAQEALDLKLVDGLVYEDELAERAGRDLGGRALRLEDDYGSELLRPWRWAPPAAIAVVPLEGDIMQGKSRPGLLGFGGSVGADDIVKALEKAGKEDQVKAVVLRVESPGGDSLASDLIWNAVRQLRKKKPVVASFGDVAASGGYYAACGADLILAEPTTITGSIGVFSMSFEASELLARFGVNTYEETRGRLAGGGLHRAMTDEERAAVTRSVEATYEVFLDRVRDGRKLTRDRAHQVAQGRVWTGTQAKEQGLVDEMGGLPDAIERAKGLVGLRGEGNVEVQVITGDNDPVTRWGSALSASARMLSGESTRQDQLREATRLLLGDPEAVQAMVRASDGRVMARLPYRVRVR
jgi:protease-4